MKCRKLASVILMGFFVLMKTADAQAQTISEGNVTEIVSDNTWKTSNTEEAWWHSIGFDDSTWNNASSPSNGTCGPNVVLDPNIAQPMWGLTPVVGGHAYFRKEFNLKELPEKATLKTVLDDDGDIYINSNLIRQDRSGSVNPEPFIDEITQFLNQGNNVIGLYVVDTAGGCQSAQVRVDLTLSYDDHVLNIPLTKQNDAQWQNDIYAGGSKDKLTCGKDLKSCGCAVTSLSMVMNYLGSHKAPNGNLTTPQTLNDYFKQNQQCSEFGCVSLGYAYGAIRWAAADQYSKESHDNFGTDKIQWLDRVKPTIDGIKRNIEDNNPVILQSPDERHWFVGYGISQNNILINDPFYERFSLGDAPYVNTAAAMVRYKKSIAPQSSVQVYGAPGEQILVQDGKGRKTGYDSEGKTVITDIPESVYYFEHHAGLAEDGVPKPHQTTSNAGVWVVSINRPESGSYSVDIAQEQSRGRYEYVVYGTSDNGVTNYKVDSGEITNAGGLSLVLVFKETRQAQTTCSDLKATRIRR